MPIAAVPVIRSVQRRRGRKDTRYQAPEVPTVAIQEEVDIGQVIEENRDLPKIQGVLSKEYLSGPFGLLGDASQPQFFELDPERASLFYWESDEKIGPPKKKLPLIYLEEVDANVHHRLLFLRFRGLSLMQLKAETTEDFNDWLEMLSKYRRPTDEAVKTLADRIRAQRLKGKSASLAPDNSAELGSAVANMFSSNKKERKPRSRDRSGRRHEHKQPEPSQSLATSMMSQKASLRVSANRTHRSKRMTGRNSNNSQSPNSDSPHRNSSDDEHHRRRSSRTSSEERWLRKAAEADNNNAGSSDEKAQQGGVTNNQEEFQIPQSWLDQEIMEDLDDYVPPMSPEEEAAARLQQERMSLADLLRREEEVARMLDGSHTIIRC